MLLSRRYIFFLSLAGLITAILAFWALTSVSAPVTEWTMINVNNRRGTGDAHVFRMPDGAVWLIDAGRYREADDSLLPFLRERNIRSIDGLVVTHAHFNHYGGVGMLLNAGIRIRRMYFNMVDRAICDRERPWGCDWDQVNEFVDEVKKAGVPISRITAGQLLYENKPEAVRMRVLYVFDGTDASPVGRTDVNDTSPVIMLETGRIRTLFPGDINKKVGAYLVQHGADLRADILKVPHHGTEDTAPDSFFDSVSAKVALVPTLEELWVHKRSSRIRAYFTSRHIPVYISGREGNVTVRYTGDTYSISSERPLPEIPK